MMNATENRVLTDNELQQVTGGENEDGMTVYQRLMLFINNGQQYNARIYYSSYKKTLTTHTDPKVRNAFKDKFGHEIDEEFDG